MIREIRLGTIGSGPIVHHILDGAAVTEGIRYEAAYSRSPERAQELAALYGAKKAYSDLDAFFKDPEVNLVYIASPNLLHYGQVKRALEAGKNVLCEKPFVVRACECRELMDLAASKGLLLLDAVPIAYLPTFSAIERGLTKIGEIRLVLANFSQYSSRYDLLKAGEMPNIFNPAFGGGCLMDIGFYNLYLCVALFGSPSDLAYYPNLYGGLVDTSGQLILRYPSFVCSCAGAKDCEGEDFFLIEGEKGSIYVEGGSCTMKRVIIRTKEKEEAVSLEKDEPRWTTEIQVLTGLLLGGNEQALARISARTLPVMEALEKARRDAGILFPGDEA